MNPAEFLFRNNMSTTGCPRQATCTCRQLTTDLSNELLMLSRGGG